MSETSGNYALKTNRLRIETPPMWVESTVNEPPKLNISLTERALKLQTEVLNIGDDWLHHPDPQDYGYDLRASITEPVTLGPSGESLLIPTGICMDLSMMSGWAPVIIPRSGLGAKQGIVVGNSVGLVDEGYMNEVFVSLWNRRPVGTAAYTINPGDRIAQVAFVRMVRPEIEVVETIERQSKRGFGGFGHTGVK